MAKRVHHCDACHHVLVGEAYEDDYGEASLPIQLQFISCSTSCRSKLACVAKKLQTTQPTATATSALQSAPPLAPPSELGSATGAQSIEASPIVSIKRFFGTAAVDPSSIADDLVRRVDLTRGAIKQNEFGIRKQAETLRTNVLVDLTALAGWKVSQNVASFDTARGFYDNDFRQIVEAALVEEDKSRHAWPGQVKYSTSSSSNPNDQKLSKEVAMLLRNAIDTAYGNKLDYAVLALNVRIVIRKVIEKRGEAAYDFLRLLFLPARTARVQDAIGAPLSDGAPVAAAAAASAPVTKKGSAFK